MKYSWILFLFFCLAGFAQIKPIKDKSTLRPAKTDQVRSLQRNNTLSLPDSVTVHTKKTTPADTIADISMYRIRDWKGKEMVIDTSLTLKKYYEVNYLRKDIFGLLPFANDGQTYNTLDFGLTSQNALPQFGFSSRNFAYQKAEDIQYYHVPNPFSEAYFRSAVKQGQNLEAFITLNTSEQLNFFVGYKGLRSLGSYINQLASIGNFKIGSSYDAKNKRYHFQTHIAVQDISNQENGGITDVNLFDANEGIYTNRERLNVFFRDANNLYKGIRTYLNHQYNIISSEKNAIWFKHQFQYEYKNNLFSQGNTNPENFYYSENPIPLPEDRITNYFGTSYASSVYDKVRNQNVYNKIAVSYANDRLGELEFAVDHLNYHYYYNSVVLGEDGTVAVPHQLKDDIVTLSGSYRLNTKTFDADFQARQSVIGNALSELKAQIVFEPYEKMEMKASYEFISKIPDFNHQVFQSNYVRYNWNNDFSNEKYNNLKADIQTPWLNATFNYRLITDKIYFSNDSTALDQKGRLQQLITTPKQHSGVINYLGLKLNKEIKFGKMTLDNTLLYQTVAQEQKILNVPAFTTRNTLYYSDYWFKGALFLQTGITFQYFTKYYANGYNPVISDFYVQNQQKIGGYPVLDFFVNAKIRTARVFLNVEHFNAKLTKSKYYTAPNYPYREMVVRIGIIWDFFN